MNLEALDAELSQASADLRRQGRLRAASAALAQALALRQWRLDDLEQELDDEMRDVERLAGLSLTALFYEILGSREEQLGRERQEMLAATLKRDACAAEITAIAAEQREIERRIAHLGNVALRYEQALELKERWLLGHPTATAVRLREVVDELVKCRTEQEELREVLEAGSSLLNGLDSVLHALRSAKSWGNWDLWWGGGMTATFIKHSRIDEARRAMHAIQPLHERFSRELADVMEPGKRMEVQLSGSEIFADWFFDNLITDWIVQQRIVNSLTRTLSYRDEVQSVHREIRAWRTAVLGQIEALTAERDSLVATT